MKQDLYVVLLEAPDAHAGKKVQAHARRDSAACATTANATDYASPTAAACALSLSSHKNDIDAATLP